MQIGADAYWDGLFSDNPPVEELIRPRSMGEENVLDEIWLIKINPTARPSVPVKPSEIIDRRNQLEGNISLFQQLGHLDLLNDMILADAFRPEFLARFDIKAPVRIPKSFHTDPDKPYHIPCIEMPVELQDLLDYEGKIDRGPDNINRLIAEGEKAATRFSRGPRGGRRRLRRWAMARLPDSGPGRSRNGARHGDHPDAPPPCCAALPSCVATACSVLLGALIVFILIHPLLVEVARSARRFSRSACLGILLLGLWAHACAPSHRC